MARQIFLRALYEGLADIRGPPSPRAAKKDPVRMCRGSPLDLARDQNASPPRRDCALHTLQPGLFPMMALRSLESFTLGLLRL